MILLVIDTTLHYNSSSTIGGCRSVLRHSPKLDLPLVAGLAALIPQPPHRDSFRLRCLLHYDYDVVLPSSASLPSTTTTMPSFHYDDDAVLPSAAIFLQLERHLRSFSSKRPFLRLRCLPCTTITIPFSTTTTMQFFLLPLSFCSALQRHLRSFASNRTPFLPLRCLRCTTTRMQCFLFR